MSAVLIPGVGLVDDTESGSAVLLPGGGLFQESASATTTYTLSAATYTNLTSTGVTPRVTVTVA
jgi:hypothetical protein